ncbi:MAG: tetratricopeptide repeat protein [bacterium]
METFHLKSTLIENDKEFVIQTANDIEQGSILSTVYVDGQIADKLDCPHPHGIEPEKVASLVKLTHQEQKQEIEALLQAYRRTLDDGSADTMYHLGTAFYYKRLYTEARELFTAAITLDNEHHQACNHLGLTQLALNLVPDAVQSFTVAVEKRPTYADYRNNLGEALLAHGSCDQAVRELEKAIGINMYYGDAHLNLSLVLIVLAQECRNEADLAAMISRAGNYLEKATLIYPDYDQGLLQKGRESLETGDLQRAYRVLLKMRQVKKEDHRREFASFFMRFLVSPEWVSEEALGERMRFLQSEITRNPGYVDLYVESAGCHWQSAAIAWQKGLQQYRQALKINPSLPTARDHLSRLQQEFENIREVLKMVVEKE